MSVHQLKDGRWFAQYRDGRKYKREYFGRGSEAEKNAKEKNDKILKDKNGHRFNFDAEEFNPQVGAYLHKDGRWFVQYRDPVSCDQVKREYFGHGANNRSRAIFRKESILSGNFNVVESDIKKRLITELKSDFKIRNIRTEVKTEVGNIDILTPRCIIEIKNISKWKAAIGQIIAYGFYHPDKKKSIHLFGKAGKKLKKLITEVCNHLNILVTFDS